MKAIADSASSFIALDSSWEDIEESGRRSRVGSFVRSASGYRLQTAAAYFYRYELN